MRASAPAASWISGARQSEAALPSWMAPPRREEPALTSWASPRERGSITDPRAYEAVARSARPRISVMPEGGYDSEQMPPPPTVPGEYRDVVRGSAPARDVCAELAEGLESMRRAVIEARREILESSEQELVRLALAIAEKVVGRELMVDADVVADWAREGIDALGSADDATCVVSPRVADILMNSDRWKHGLTVIPEVVVDARLSGFRCDVRGKFGRVETGVRERLGAVAEALGSGPSA
jgi:hypothetical protein